MSTRTMMSVEEFERLPDDDNLHELDAGELIIMPALGWKHGRLQLRIGFLLEQAAQQTHAGAVVTETGFRLAPDTIRAPDVAVVGEQRRPEISLEGYCNFSPDLAVEILSPDDNASRVQKKVTDYLAAGSTAVWVVDPATVTVSVFHKAGTFRTLKADDEIGFPEVLSNWRVPGKSFFE